MYMSMYNGKKSHSMKYSMCVRTAPEIHVHVYTGEILN